MTKFYGAIGFSIPTMTAPGVWADVITEIEYRGDVTRLSRRTQSSADSLNSDLVLSNQLSIIADAFANDHIFAIRYIKWMGAKWSVTNVEVQRPRLILTIGGVYNG